MNSPDVEALAARLEESATERCLRLDLACRTDEYKAAQALRELSDRRLCDATVKRLRARVADIDCKAELDGPAMLTTDEFLIRNLADELL